MKRIISLTLALLLSLALCGCGNSKTMEALTGNTWCTTEYLSEQEAAELLENMDFYESEIAMADLSAVGAAKILEFSGDKTYRFLCDAEATRAMARNYLDDFISTLARNRAQLTGDYNEAMGVDVAAMTEEEFKVFYAELFGSADYPELLDYLAANFFDYSSIPEILESGTFSLSDERIFFIPEGETEEVYVEHVLTDSTLTITYADGVEVYTKG